MRTPVGIVGFRGYSGAELVSILSRHPSAEPILIEHRESSERPRPLGDSEPRRIPLHCRLHPRGRSGRRISGDARRCRHGPRAHDSRNRRGRDRPQRRVPPGQHRNLGALVSRAAHPARAASRSCLRAPGILPDAFNGRPADRQSRLLSDRGQSGHPASGARGRDRSRGGHRLRRQERRQRRWTKTGSKHQLLRSDR